MAPTYLDSIVDTHRSRAARDARDWRERVDVVHYEGPSFADALRSTNNPNVAVIAEVKRRSPSKGWIDEHLDVAALATAYEKGSASAVSVLTDNDFFAGSPKDVARVREVSTLPILRKDFTVCENDVLDAAQMGASAVLLIVAVLGDEELTSFLRLAHACGIDALVEVHDATEGRRALDAGARIIGVNQRDLRSFEVDPRKAAEVVDSLDGEITRVAESGMTSVDDVVRAAQAGFDAVLVGEAFVRTPDTSDLVHDFASVPRVPRG
jgi:indole-3-glycerol phosphate synthase